MHPAPRLPGASPRDEAIVAAGGTAQHLGGTRQGLRRGEGGMGHAEAPSDTNNQKYGLKATKKYQKMEVHHLVGGWATPLKNIRQLG